MGEKPQVTFIGLGRMGAPMAGNLLAAGHSVTGSDLSFDGCTALEEAGGTGQVDPLRAVDGADVVVLMLPDSRVVDALLLDTGVARGPAGGDPRAGHELVRAQGHPTARRAGGRGRHHLRRRAGLGRGVRSTGRIAHDHGRWRGHRRRERELSATHLPVTSEAMLVARAFGLDVGQVLDAVNTSSGHSGSTEKQWPDSIVPQTYDSGFGPRLMVKDMGIAVTLAESTGVPSPLAHDALTRGQRASGDISPRTPTTPRSLAG